MLRMLCGVLALCLISTPSTAQSQDRWVFEIRGGAALATENLNDAELGTGFGFEGTIAYRFQPHLAAYAGWDWHRFPADESFAGSSVDVEETGYAFGLAFEHPIGRLASPTF